VDAFISCQFFVMKKDVLFILLFVLFVLPDAYEIVDSTLRSSKEGQTQSFSYSGSSNSQCLNVTCLNDSACVISVVAPGTPCNNGDFCDGFDFCDENGSCVSTNVDPCENSSLYICNGTCNSTTHSCHAAFGTSCEDGLFCNGIDYCNGQGSCIHSGDPCVNDSSLETICDSSCNEDGQNCSAPIGTLCSTGMPSSPNCSIDLCNGEGNCTRHSFTGLSCDDDINNCSINPLCSDSGLCMGIYVCACNSSEECNDGNPCTDEICLANDCIYFNNSSPCNDGLWCNGEDSCADGYCSVHSGDPCDGNPVCNNTCNEWTFSCFSSLGIPCDTDDYHLFCDGEKRCNGFGLCETIPACPSNPCNNSCNETEKTCYSPYGTSCGDSNYCNGEEYCNGFGQCLSTGDPCRNLSACYNQCREDLKRCLSLAGYPCNDSLFCNGEEFCDGNGSCLSSGSPCLQKITDTCCIESNRTCISPASLSNRSLCVFPAGTTGMSPSSTHHSTSNTHLYGLKPVLIAGIVSGSVTLSIGLLIGVYKWSKRKRKSLSSSSSSSSTLSSSSSSVTGPNSTASIVAVTTSNMNPSDVDSIELSDLLSWKNIELGPLIGHGHSAEVYKGVLLEPETGSRIVVALKKPKLPLVELEFLEEARIMRNLKHPNVVRFLGLSRLSVDERYLVTEYFPLGNLLNVLKMDRELELLQLYSMSLQAALGMQYIASQMILHRDLACRNLLVSRSASRYVVKISDFGLAKHFIPTAAIPYYVSTETLLPIKWSAPEVLTWKRFSTASDVFSFGICLWEIFSRGQEPYPTLENQEVHRIVLRGFRMSQPFQCPTPIFDLMMQCWREVPSSRPTFDQVVDILRKIGISAGNSAVSSSSTSYTELELSNSIDRMDCSDSNDPMA